MQFPARAVGHSVSLCGNVVTSPLSCPSETLTVAIREESLEAMYV